MIPLPPAATMRLIGAAVLLAGAAAGGWRLKAHFADAEIAKLKAAHAVIVAAADKAKTKAVQSALDQSREAIARAEEIVNAAREEEARLAAARARADAAGSQLQQAAREYQRRRAACGLAAAASGGAPGGMPAGMQEADRILLVLGRLDARAGAYAEAADRSRARGLRCERWVDEVVRPLFQSGTPGQ